MIRMRVGIEDRHQLEPVVLEERAVEILPPDLGVDEEPRLGDGQPIR